MENVLVDWEHGDPQIALAHLDMILRSESGSEIYTVSELHDLLRYFLRPVPSPVSSPEILQHEDAEATPFAYTILDASEDKNEEQVEVIVESISSGRTYRLVDGVGNTTESSASESSLSPPEDGDESEDEGEGVATDGQDSDDDNYELPEEEAGRTSNFPWVCIGKKFLYGREKKERLLIPKPELCEKACVFSADLKRHSKLFARLDDGVDMFRWLRPID
ncbi:MAG: hypothetical protein M4579_001663 [Chaenotheca gracillima]|nr:MAG: hypothetical protein M4579_001663 [Chaenotheca gracillima]